MELLLTYIHREFLQFVLFDENRFVRRIEKGGDRSHPQANLAARITSIDTSRAEALPGVHLVLTHRDAPDVLYSTGRHQSRLDDPDDTRMLDPVLRFAGQRVAVVVAETVATAQEACRLVDVEYEVLPAVLDPDAARRPGAPLVHGDKDPVVSRIAEPTRNVVAQLHDEHKKAEQDVLSLENVRPNEVSFPTAEAVVP